jgi:hypothetical protein
MMDGRLQLMRLVQRPEKDVSSSHEMEFTQTMRYSVEAEV